MTRSGSFLQRPEWQSVTCVFLCLAALVFPFSVAAANVALGIAIASGIVSGRIWEGAKRIWHGHRWLAVGMLVYTGLFVLGLAWSIDPDWGLHVIGRQWFWLLVPLAVAALASEIWRNRFLGALSLGLALHLGFCLLQMYGYVSVTVRGSGMLDATGHVGHVGFGFVYGIWAAWLLHWGWEQSGAWRLLAWSLSLWAGVAIFAAQGRSGYLVALAAVVAVLWKRLLSGHGWRRTGITVCLFLTLIGILMMAGPIKERAQESWRGFQALQQGKLAYAEPRWSFWIAAIEAWKLHPVLGIGTGGFPKISGEIKRRRPELNYDFPMRTKVRVSQPHNAYLLALARWSAWGLAVLCAFLFFWIRTGWQQDWKRFQTAPLIALSGIALAVHGLSSSSLEEHFSGVLAALLLGLGLAELSADNSNRHFRIKHNPAGSTQ